MSKEQDKTWRDKKGKPITFLDCKHAVHQAISVMEKEVVSSSVMKKSDSMYFTYKRHIDVLEVVREKFDMLHKATKKAQRKTVKKRGTSKVH
ncbi:MAG: hypothetical protein KAW52_00310 [candidate division Zixibacteria bacterium]|nr:hypothetical protein [candidate division Zixibacteria bacterium]